MPFDKRLTRLLSNDAALIAENWSAGNLDDALTRAVAARYLIKSIESAIHRDMDARPRRLARFVRMCYHATIRG